MRKRLKVQNSLSKTLKSARIPDSIVNQYLHQLSYTIDFQRDVKNGDTIELLYEANFTKNDAIVGNPVLLYGLVHLNYHKIELFRYKLENGKVDFFDANGKSIRKYLMRTPVQGARLSSKFGVRKHPILGFNKMHRGTDFAAPTGTPIMASGSGTVTRARWCGGGGNCVKIKHNSTYETVYAHMKAFAKGVKEGRKVKQGQIIGYVGSTGLSTGPHLHYEVIVNGKKVNSQRLKLPSGKILKGEARKEFELKRIKIDFKELLNPTRDEDKGNDLWSVFNVVQEKIIDGDFAYKVAGKLRKARQIKNFKQDQKINKELFDVALEFAS